jgi:ABC-type amino acid transport substrate-binding protein
MNPSIFYISIFFIVLSSLSVEAFEDKINIAEQLVNNKAKTNMAAVLESLTYITEENPPASYMKNGKVQGVAVDLLKEILGKLGNSNQEVILVPWARAYYYLLNQDNIVLFSISKTKERVDKFKWACPISITSYSLIAKKKSNITISDIKDLEKYVIGTVKADASEKIIIDKLGSDENIYSAVSSKAAFGMLMKDRVQLIAYISSSFDKLIIENGYRLVDFEEVMSLGEREICFAFSKNIDTTVINKFQKELQKIIKHTQFEFFH